MTYKLDKSRITLMLRHLFYFVLTNPKFIGIVYFSDYTGLCIHVREELSKL